MKPIGGLNVSVGDVVVIKFVDWTLITVVLTIVGKTIYYFNDRNIGYGCMGELPNHSDLYKNMKVLF